MIWCEAYCLSHIVRILTWLTLDNLKLYKSCFLTFLIVNYDKFIVSWFDLSNTCALLYQSYNVLFFFLRNQPHLSLQILQNCKYSTKFYKNIKKKWPNLKEKTRIHELPKKIAKSTTKIEFVQSQQLLPFHQNSTTIDDVIIALSKNELVIKLNPWLTSIRYITILL